MLMDIYRFEPAEISLWFCCLLLGVISLPLKFQRIEVNSTGKHSIVLLRMMTNGVNMDEFYLVDLFIPLIRMSLLKGLYEILK